jgi:hypothetical protein
VIEHPLLWVGSQRRFDDPPKGFWVAVPVVVRRLIVEAPPEIQDSDPFARAVVNLALAGVQRIPDIAALIGIEDLDFVSEVIRRLAGQKIVTVQSGLVEVVAEHTGSSRPLGERYVWHVIQDTYTGALWPRVAAKVRQPDFDDPHHLVELGNPGRPSNRKYWPMPPGDAVDDPHPTAVKQAVMRHLEDLRTVGIKRNTRGAEHLATLGRPERRPVFSARLAPGRESARLLVRLEASGEHISAHDPFEVGAWFELAAWTEHLLDRSPALRGSVSAWASRSDRGRTTDGSEEPDGAVPATAGAPTASDTTLSRPVSPPPAVDRNTLLLSLADRLRDEIGRAAKQSLALTYDANRDAATLTRRWASFGFRIPREFVRSVPALVERAAEGFPADLHVLFYAWTFLVDPPDGEALARQAPDLPSVLYENASGRTSTAIPDLRIPAALQRGLPTESRS